MLIRDVCPRGQSPKYKKNSHLGQPRTSHADVMIQRPIWSAQRCDSRRPAPRNPQVGPHNQSHRGHLVCHLPLQPDASDGVAPALQRLPYHKLRRRAQIAPSRDRRVLQIATGTWRSRLSNQSLYRRTRRQLADLSGLGARSVEDMSNVPWDGEEVQTHFLLVNQRLSFASVHGYAILSTLMSRVDASDHLRGTHLDGSRSTHRINRPLHEIRITIPTQWAIAQERADDVHFQTTSTGGDSAFGR